MTQAQDPVAADFEATPSFTEDFGTAATPGYVGRWNFLPLLTTQSYFSSVSTPTILTATPGTLNANWVTNNPVAGSTSGAVLAMGNLASTAATTFGLNYWICDNSAADGSGTDFTTLTDYRAVARVYLPSVADAPGRFQVGLIAHSGATGTLFETSNFYNTSSTGIGPGFGARGVLGGTQAFPTTSALATSGWRLISIMIKGDRVAIGVDANGDNTIDESDPLEYQVYDRNTANPANGPFGFFTVGTVDGVTLDERPLLIDWVSVYLPATPPPPPPPLSAENWSMYE
jgi:hypothetical protein